MKDLKGLHFVTGEKGGVGKSLFAMVLLEYLNNLGIEHKFYDADRSSPDVGLAYGEFYHEFVSSLNKDTTSELDKLNDLVNNHDDVLASNKKDITNIDLEEEEEKEEEELSTKESKTQIYFSEDRRESFRADKLYNDVSDGNLVVVNLPAQVELLVNKWLTNRSILDDSDFPIYYWFVTDGSPESLTLMERSLSQYGDRIEHIIVRNSGLNKSVDDAIIRHSVLESMRSLKTKMVEMPQLILSNPQMQVVKINRLKLSDVTRSGAEIKGLGSLPQIRTKSFLQKCHIQIDKIAVFGEEKTLSTTSSNN